MKTAAENFASTKSCLKQSVRVEWSWASIPSICYEYWIMATKIFGKDARQGSLNASDIGQYASVKVALLEKETSV